MPESKDSEVRRNEFVDAAEKLFQENGIVDTTISSIVKEMDVAKGLFYYYFKSKDDVIEAISEKYNEVFREMLNAAMDQEDYESRLKQYVHNSVASFRELNNKLQGKSGEVDLSALSNRSIDDAKQEAIKALQDLLEEGNTIGELTITHARYYANILVSGIVELIEENEATDDEIEFIIYDLIERAGKD
jgi:AcrR family transcriptional regulator